MRTCPKVWGIAAHCMWLCPRNGETTAGLTELTINCNNDMYWCVYATGTRITLKKNNYKKPQRTQINGFKFSYITKV